MSSPPHDPVSPPSDRPPGQTPGNGSTDEPRSDAIRPSVAAMQRRLGEELSRSARLGTVALLLTSLIGAGLLAVLWWTEPELPARTQVAFGVLLSGCLAWAGLFAWTLATRRALLGRHRVVAARLAVLYSAVFALGSLLLAAFQPHLRTQALGAALWGAVLLGLAALLLARATTRMRRLQARRRELTEALERPPGGRPTAWLLVLCLAAAWTAATADAVEAREFRAWAGPQIEIATPTAPTVVPALGRAHLVYEVHLTQFGETSRRLERLEVIDPLDDRILGSWSGADLARRLHPVGRPGLGAPDRLELAPGARTVAFVWVALPPGRPVPASITHRLRLAAPEGAEATPEAARLQAVNGPVVPVDRRAVEDDGPLLHPPVGPGRWAILAGPSNGSRHRVALLALDGRARIAQRFAVDWARLGPDGRLFTEDGSANDQWHAFGEPVLAGRAGRVVRVVDDHLDHPPRSVDPTRFRDRAAIPGNLVVIEEDGGGHSLYAHLRRGSIRVEVGERVEAGRRLGEIGNSGQSFAPHLHHHRSDGPAPLAAEGLPSPLSAFRLIGKLDGPEALIAGEAWHPDPRRPARPIEREMPLEDMVLEVP